MELNELIKMLESMISCKALYSEQIGSEFLYMRCRPDPKSCVIEQAAKELKRLAEIQEILGDTYDLDHLRELVEADKAGRLYKFRFGVGSTVYRVWVRPGGTHPFISEDKIECLRDMMRSELWAEPYSTREEAEATLEKIKDGQA